MSWPTRSSHSFLLTSWAVFAALLVLIYSSLLINFLTFPAKSKVPTTWDELLETPDYGIMMEGNSFIKPMFEVGLLDKKAWMPSVLPQYSSSFDKPG